MICKLFKSTLSSCRIHLATGETVDFLAGRFFTTDADIEAKVVDFIGKGHPHIYVDPAEPTFDTEAVTPERQASLATRRQMLANLGISEEDYEAIVAKKESGGITLASTQAPAPAPEEESAAPSLFDDGQSAEAEATPRTAQATVGISAATIGNKLAALSNGSK